MPLSREILAPGIVRSYLGPRCLLSSKAPESGHRKPCSLRDLGRIRRVCAWGDAFGEDAELIADIVRPTQEEERFLASASRPPRRSEAGRNDIGGACLRRRAGGTSPAPPCPAGARGREGCGVVQGTAPDG